MSALAARMPLPLAHNVGHMDVSEIVRVAQLVDKKSRFTADPKCTLLRALLQKQTSTAVKTYLDQVLAVAQAKSPKPALMRTISVAEPAGWPSLQRTVSVDDTKEEMMVVHEEDTEIHSSPAPTVAASSPSPVPQPCLPAPSTPAATTPLVTPISVSLSAPVSVATTQSRSLAVTAPTTPAASLPSFFVPAGAPLPALPTNATLAMPVFADGKWCLMPLTQTGYQQQQQQQQQAQPQFVWTAAPGKKPQRRRSNSNPRSRSPSPTHSHAQHSSLQAGPALMTVSA